LIDCHEKELNFHAFTVQGHKKLLFSGVAATGTRFLRSRRGFFMKKESLGWRIKQAYVVLKCVWDWHNANPSWFGGMNQKCFIRTKEITRIETILN